MMKLSHKFVKNVPDQLEDGVVYVSIEYAMAIHKCCCGCGNEVVTSLSPTDWKLIFDGISISLDPSIGNWGFDCKSHYWIRCNKVIWAPRWSKEKIKAGRTHDQFIKERYFKSTKSMRDKNSGESILDKAKKGFWQKLKKWWS